MKGRKTSSIGGSTPSISFFRVDKFEPKIVNNLAETKANMHYGLKVCFILENMGINLRDHGEISVTNSLFRHA